LVLGQQMSRGDLLPTSLNRFSAVCADVVHTEAEQGKEKNLAIAKTRSAPKILYIHGTA